MVCRYEKKTEFLPGKRKARAETGRRRIMKIAIMTFYQEDNYGTVLQAAALSRYLTQLGHQADLIQYVSDGRIQTIHKDSARKEFSRRVREELREERNPLITGKLSGESFEQFRRKHLTETFACVTLPDLERLNEIYDVFICGSERIWYATSFDSHLFLDFVHDPRRMIAYAPSLLREGMQDLHVRKRMGELISRFSFLSVREEIGRKLLDEYFSIHTEEVADPVLLLNGREWEEFFINAEKEQPEDSTDGAGPEDDDGAERVHSEGEGERSSEGISAGGIASEGGEAWNASEDGLTRSAAVEEEILSEKVETGSEEGETIASEEEEEIAPEEEEEIAPEEEEETAPEDEEEIASEDEEETAHEDGEGITAEAVNVPYMFVYFLSGKEAYWNAAYKLAQRLGLDVKAVPVYEKDLSRPASLNTPVDPADFVRLIRDASYVCTDCYHATLMGIVFQREMCCFNRYPDGDMSGRNIRIRQILDAVGMLDRLYDDNTPLEQYLEKTDFIPVQYKLDALQLKSHAFLKASLAQVQAAEKREEDRVFHVREAYRLCCGCGACQAVCPQGAAVVSMQANGFYEAVVDEEKCIRCGRCTQVCPMREECRGIPLEDGALLSYSDEQAAVREASDAGGLARRLTGLLLDQGYIIAGCAFDENLLGARHILIHPDDEIGAGEAKPAEPGKPTVEATAAASGAPAAGEVTGAVSAASAVGETSGAVSAESAAGEAFTEEENGRKEPLTEEAEAVCEDIMCEDAGSEDPSSKDAAHEAAALEDTMSEDTALKDQESESGEAPSEEALSEEALTEEESAGKAFSEEALSEEAFSEETSSGDVEAFSASASAVKVEAASSLADDEAQEDAFGEEPCDDEEDLSEDSSGQEEAAPEIVRFEEKATREELLSALQGIKLSQSDFSAVWTLEANREHPALIIGAPCQIAAARKVFEDRSDILYMDFVCGGVPTKLLIEKYRHTFRGRGGISQERFRIRLRYKNQDKGNQYILITDDTKEKIIPMRKDALCRMLDMGGCCSEACFNCRWRDRSCADIRIGTADGSGTGEKEPGVMRIRTKGNEVPSLSAGCFGSKKEDVTALFCMTPQGKKMLDLLMTSGYWEGLHRQRKEVYLQDLRTVNNPVPVYYPELMEMLADENTHLKKILNEYAKPAEKREKVLRRMQRFTRAGRKRARQLRARALRAKRMEDRNDQ